MRSLARLAAIALIAGLGSGCSSTSEDPDRGSTMTIHWVGNDVAGMRLYRPKSLLWLPLVDRYGPDIRPRLAESWEHSPDYRTWTIHLRDDVRWHDGVPVTAHDVAFSFELFAHPDVLFPASGGAVWIDSISVPDDHTITLAFARPTDPRHEWTVFFPKHLLEDLDPAEFYEWDFWTRPVGNGPYRFVRRVPQTMFELEANPDFYAGEPPIKRMVVKFGGASDVIELMSGAADVALSVEATEVLRFRADPRFVVYHRYDWSELILIYWNHRHPLLADATVRRALSQAIDRRELAQVLNLPDEMPLVGGLGNDGMADPDRRRGWHQGPIYDPETAERLLEQAGWIDRDGDGIRERAGREARFTLLAPRGGYVGGVTQAVLIQQQLQNVGVATEIRPMESSGLVRAAIRSGDFDAGIVWENQDPDTIFDVWFGELSGFGYYDAEAAHLLEVVLAEPDPEAQDTLYARINEIIRRDMPVTFLFPSMYIDVAHRRIRGLRQEWPTSLTYAEELWIEDEP